MTNPVTNDLTADQLVAFSKTFRQIKDRIEFIAGQRDLDWTHEIDFSDWDPSDDQSGIEISWQEYRCGSTEYRSDWISAEDLLQTSEHHIEERRLRLIREEEARQARAREEERLRQERARENDLDLLRRLTAKYPNWDKESK